MPTGTPIFFSQSADGTILYEYEGKLHAVNSSLDIDLIYIPIGANIAIEEAPISWQLLRRQGNYDPDTTPASLYAGVGPGGAGFPPNISYMRAKVLNESNVARTRTLVDANDASSFLSFAAAVARTHKVNYGIVNSTWPGGGTVGVDLTGIAHGLGVVPQIILVQSANAATSVGNIAETDNWTSTTFTIRCFKIGLGGAAGTAVTNDAPAAGTAIKLAWLAIG